MEEIRGTSEDAKGLMTDKNSFLQAVPWSGLQLMFLGCSLPGRGVTATMKAVAFDYFTICSEAYSLPEQRQIVGQRYTALYICQTIARINYGFLSGSRSQKIIDHMPPAPGDHLLPGSKCTH